MILVGWGRENQRLYSIKGEKGINMRITDTAARDANRVVLVKGYKYWGDYKPWENQVHVICIIVLIKRER